MFRCSTAYQCSLVQSGYGMPTIYTQAIVSNFRGIIAVMRTSRERKAIWSQSGQLNYHKGSGLCIIAKGHPHQLNTYIYNLG